MTKEQIETIYEAVSHRFKASGPLKRNDITGIRDELLANDETMSGGSAEIYVEVLSKLLIGESYFMSINQKAAKYFLENIHSDFGQTILRKALSSFKGHIKSENEAKKPRPVPGLKKIHSEFSARLN